MWTIELELVKDWLNSLDRESKIQVLAALEILKEQGPNLKQAKWNKWYKTAIPEAERRYVAWLENQYGKETK